MLAQRNLRLGRVLALLLIALPLLAVFAPNVPRPAIFAQESAPPSGNVIVVLKRNGKELPAQAAGKARVHARHVYSHVISGFSTTLTAAEAQTLANDTNVARIYPEEQFQAAAQSLPTGLQRIGADQNTAVDVDEIDDVRVHTDVAVLDSGISDATGDLNLSGGVNCSTSTSDYNDDVYGHGTHVAGTIGAFDNNRGVVGVAPGARLWSVKVLNDGGGAFTSNLLCGLDWVVANKAAIDVVNMSIVGTGTDGPCDVSAFHLAICSVVNDSRIPVIVAAGNTASDASRAIPATYGEVIAVSAVSDLDGLPGGVWTGPSCRTGEIDDTLASYSNYGPDIDIAAPGTCILSLAQDGTVAVKSGTSMATPHVTGAAAIYLDANPSATPDEVRAWLLATAKPQSSPEGFTGDRDSSHEPLLWLGGSAPPPSAPYRLIASGASPNSAASTYVRDGRLSTIWKTKLFKSGPPAGAWVWVDLGAPKPIGTIRWVFGEAGIADYFEIEGSNNLNTWKYITKRNGKPVGVWQEKVTGVNYRYIRFRFENPRGDLTLGGLAEVQIWAPGTAYPLPGVTPTATPTRTPAPTVTPGARDGYPFYGSSRSSNSTLPRAVWDGDLGTTWQTDGLSVPASAYVYVTLGAVLPIETIRWIYGTGDIGDQLTIQVSNDKVIWTPIHAAGNAPVGEWQVATFSGLSAKYVRWWFANPNSDPVIGGLAEVEVYAPGAYSGSETGTSTPVVTATLTSSPEIDGTPAAGTPETPGSPEAIETATPDATGDGSPVAIESPPATTESPGDTSEPPADISETPVVIGDTPVVTTSPTLTLDATSTPYPVVQTRRSASSLPGTLAIDGKPETVWRSKPEGDPGRVAVLTLDLGESRNIGEVRILPGGEGMLGRATIETSSDGVKWSWYAEPGTVAAGDDGWLQIGPGDGVATPMAAQFVRVVFAGDGNEPLGGIAEIEVLPPSP